MVQLLLFGDQAVTPACGGNDGLRTLNICEHMFAMLSCKATADPA